MKICIFGAASSKIDNMYIQKVEALGEALAAAGHSLIFGAGNDGLMGAAARGFTKGEGKTIGVIPNFFRDESLSEIYKCSELIFTETMHERKHTMEDLADAFIIVPGGIGTFEEFFEVLTLKQLGRHGKAMVIYNIDGFYDELQEFLKTVTDKKFIVFELDDLYAVLNTSDEVVKYLDNYAPKITLCKRDG